MSMKKPRNVRESKKIFTKIRTYIFDTSEYILYIFLILAEIFVYKIWNNIYFVIYFRYTYKCLYQSDINKDLFLNNYSCCFFRII